jgi:DNA-binding NarL/FixJ family response regulator
MSARDRITFRFELEPLTDAAGATTRQAGVAACLLDAMEDEQIAAAMRLDVFTVGSIVRRLMARTGTTNRVGLALALRELV